MAPARESAALESAGRLVQSAWVQESQIQQWERDGRVFVEALLPFFSPEQVQEFAERAFDERRATAIELRESARHVRYDGSVVYDRGCICVAAAYDAIDAWERARR